MKNLTLIIAALFSFSITCVRAQTQWGDLNIEQKFDAVYNDMYLNDVQFPWNAYEMYYGSESVSISNQNNLGSYGIAAMDALLVMYEATCDLKYIQEFMIKATAIMNARADKVSPQFSNYPYWFKDKVMWHGRVLMPLTKFVYMVKTDTDLASQIISNPSAYGGNSNYLQFANWVNQSNREVMDYMLQRYWNSSTKCFCKPNESAPGPTILQPCNNTVAELNFQVPFGCALIYLHLVNGTSSFINYGLKAVNMAQAHLITSGGIYTYDSANLAYHWKHQGWNTSMNYKEDIAHGGMDILFPILYNKYHTSFSNITAGMYFEDYQMVRLRNGFARYIYNWSQHANIEAAHDNNTAFDANVDNTNTGQWDPVQNSQANLQLSAITWSDLYKFDDVSGKYGYDVYDILMKFYQYEVVNTASSQFGGLKIKGLADLCKANYDMENLPRTCAYVSRKKGTEELLLNLSPNPAEQFVNVELFNSNASMLSTIRVVDAFGRLRKELTTFESSEAIDLSDLEVGVYVVTVIQGSTIESKQLHVLP